MTNEQYLKNKEHIDNLEKKFNLNFEKKVDANNKEIEKLKQKLIVKNKKFNFLYDKKLLSIQKKFEKKKNKINKQYELKIEKLLNKNLTKDKYLIEKYSKTKIKILNVIQNKFTKEIKEIEKKRNLINEECNWTLNDFQNSTQKILNEEKNTATYKFNIARSKNEFRFNKSKKKKIIKNNVNNTKSKQERIYYKKQLQHITLNTYNEKKYLYVPVEIKSKNFLINFKSKTKNSVNSFGEKIKISFKSYSFKDFIKLPIFGCPLYLYVILLAAALIAIFTKTVSTNIITGLSLLLLFSMIIGTIFNKVPIWKTYLGGGAVACFIIAGLLGKTFNVIPENVQTDIKDFFSGGKGGGFLNLYITILLCSTILTLPKKMVATSFGKYGLFLILTVAISGLIGFGIGKAMNLQTDVILLRVLAPLFGGGNGGGAVPMSDIASATGYAVEGHEKFYGNILVIVVLSNVIMIIASGIMNPIMSKSAKLSGNGKLMNKSIFVAKEDDYYKDRHVTIALVLCTTIFVLSHTLQEIIQRSTKNSTFVNGLIISQFAWAIVISLILNISGIIPIEIKNGNKKLSNFFTKEFTLVIMTGIGLGIDFKTLVNEFDIRLIWLTIITCMFLIFTPFCLAKLFSMFPFEAAISAGTCMGAMGGAGAIACMSASKRMELMPYSQISSRIGGSIILIISSPLFTLFAPKLS